MRKISIALLLAGLFFTNSIQAQAEVKFSPIFLIGEVGMASFEYGFTEDFGTEANVVLASEFSAIVLSGKYYLSPRRGLDRFHVGMFVGAGGQFGVGVGFLIGTKIVSEKRVLFEFGGGVGRSFVEGGVLPYLKLDLGYRFGRKEKKKKTD